MAEFTPILNFHKVLGAERGGNMLVVSPKGSTFGFRADDLQTEYNRIHHLFDQTDLDYLIIDCSLTDYVDSALVGVFIGLSKKVTIAGGRTILCGLTERVEGILRNMQLLERPAFEHLWSHELTRDDAVASLAE
jgi:anti-anti-sigma factor